VLNRLRDPRGDLMSEVGGSLAVGGTARNPDWLSGIMIVSVIQFEAAEEGTYTIEIVVDESEKSLPIHVVHGLPPGISPPES
jgi:hypothetical protein